MITFDLEYQLAQRIPGQNQPEFTLKEVEYEKWTTQYESEDAAKADLFQLINTRQAYWQYQGIFTEVYRASAKVATP